MDDIKKQRYKFIAAVNAISIVGLAVMLIILFNLKSALPSQLAAERWNSSDERFAQVSLFYSETNRTDLNNIYTMRVNIEKKLAENSVEAASPDARMWIDAFSAPMALSVSSQRSDYTVTADANCFATGGDFFKFHPLKLLSGCYYSDEDLMQDRVILDNDLAWQLFGSYDIQGMTVVINGQRFYIAGVILPDDDTASEYARGETPVMYMSYTAAERLTEGNPPLITSYEVCLPDPVTGLAENIVRDVSGADDKNIRIVNNTERFSLKSLWKRTFDGGKSAAEFYPMAYPFWENAARITEERASDTFAAALAFAVIPFCTALVLLGRLYRKLRFILGSAVKKLAEAVTI